MKDAHFRMGLLLVIMAFMMLLAFTITLLVMKMWALGTAAIFVCVVLWYGIRLLVQSYE